MADDLDKVALADVAMAILRKTWDTAKVDGDVSWGDYPDLTEDQWKQVMAMIDKTIDALTPNEHQFVAAYERLTGETP